MNEYRDRLMAWKPGDPGFNREETILAVGSQCRTKRFPLSDVLSWIGVPDKAIGDSARGHLVYFQSGPVTGDRKLEEAYMFDVEGGKVVESGSIGRFRDNGMLEDGKTTFNVLDEMDSFDEEAFR